MPLRSHNPRSRRKLIALVLLMGAFACAINGVQRYLGVRQFISTATHATGKITEINSRPQNGSTYYYEVFTYTDGSGTVHRISSNFSSSGETNEVGDTVTVLYHPETPGDAKIASFSSLWLKAAVFALLTAVFLIAGLVVWFWPAFSGFWLKSTAPRQSGK